MSHEREQVNALAAELIGQKDSQESDISSREEELRSQRGRLTSMQNERGTIEIELAQKNYEAALKLLKQAQAIADDYSFQQQLTEIYRLTNQQELAAAF